MSTYWLRNMTGVGLCDAQLEIVPYPLAELGIHITCKTIQVRDHRHRQFIQVVMGLYKKDLPLVHSLKK